MNANTNTPGQRPAGPDESAQLLSRTARDLPAGRHQFHKERLMARIQQEQRTETTTPAGARRFRLPRPSITLPLAAAAVAGAVVVVLALPAGGPGALATGPAMTTPVGVATTQGVPELLDRISLAAAEGPRPAVRPGQYLYIESQTSDTFLKTVGDKTTLASYALHRRQKWNSPDGTRGWLIDPASNPGSGGETLSLPDEHGRPPVATLNTPSYDYLDTLTTDPDELLAKIYRETKGKGTSPDQQAFTTIGDLLGETYPPAQLYPALFRAAAKIPGVVVVQGVVDALGRHGVGVARLDGNSGQREEWIFDRTTHVFLGRRTVQVAAAADAGAGAVIPPGTITFTSAITHRAVVDGIRQTPSNGG
ncbi:CU044_5270 family protein [Streptomyces goshikiensis]|uniref:CU044_5270 family protein n=1 Tax=Streptomyces goshikiensis TaxID=1942 RepID=UPI0036942D9D